MLSNLPEHTRHAIDVGSPVTTVATATVAVVTLNQVVMALTAFSLLLNIGWMVLKYLYLRKHGADVMWGNGDD